MKPNLKPIHQRRAPFFLAKVHDLRTGLFLLTCRVQAEDLKQAERVAVSRASYAIRGNPAEMDVRHLHQTSASVGSASVRQ